MASSINSIYAHVLKYFNFVTEVRLVNIEEQEILEFYRTGASISQIAEVYGITQYRLKKFLANEPALQPLGYIWRSLYPSNKNLNLI